AGAEPGHWDSADCDAAVRDQYVAEFSAEQAGQAEYAGADPGCVDRDDVRGASAVGAGGAADGAALGDCCAGADIGWGVCVDRGSAGLGAGGSRDGTVAGRYTTGEASHECVLG